VTVGRVCGLDEYDIRRAFRESGGWVGDMWHLRAALAARGWHVNHALVVVEDPTRCSLMGPCALSAGKSITPTTASPGPPTRRNLDRGMPPSRGGGRATAQAVIRELGKAELAEVAMGVLQPPHVRLIRSPMKLKKYTSDTGRNRRPVGGWLSQTPLWVQEQVNRTTTVSASATRSTISICRSLNDARNGSIQARARAVRSAVHSSSNTSSRPSL
jgi:hypothetical protein